MSDNTYNGWTNYETWRVNLEIIDDALDWITEGFDEKPDKYELSQYLETYVDEVVFCEDPDQETLVSQYAASFLEDVNYREIAEHILSGWPEDETEEEDEVEQ